MGERFEANVALAVTTFAFTICLACWVLNGVLVTYLVSANVFKFSAAEVGWLLAIPFLTGSVSRVPLGILADRYGGRIVFFGLMLAAAVPLYLVSRADGLGELLLASAGFGFTGGGFAVGVAYVAAWFTKQQQGTALGIFGMGNAGAALTTLVAPSLLVWLTDDGADPSHWRRLPQIYAAALALVAVLFFALTKNRVAATGRRRTLAENLAPLASVRVWRFGLYYFLLFGAFVAIAQWLVPYSVNVYGISIVQAGLLASAFSFPSGVIRAAGGWLSDRFGARTVMYWVFMSSVLSCAFLAVPRMDIDSPGSGVTASQRGVVEAVTPTSIVVGDNTYDLVPPVALTPARADAGDMVWLRITRWHEPTVAEGDAVAQGELIARGVTNIYYPANLWLFAFAVIVFGVATGIGMAAVYKFIPDYFPENVGVVGGIVGMIGALGGFVLPPAFGLLLNATGIWASCWLLLALVSLGCLFWMQRVIRGILEAEAPNLSQLVEFRPRTALLQHAAEPRDETTVEDLLLQVPIFSHLSPEELKSLAGVGRFESAQPGAVLLREGDAGDSSFLLLRGAVEVFRTSADGQEIGIATLRPGEMFGELALIDGEPRSASARAVGKCDLFVISRDNFIKLLSTSPRVLGDIMVGLSGRIRSSNAEHFRTLLERERLRTQGELERHRMITQMVAGVAHEVNTPVGIANHAASIISEQLAPGRLAALAKDENAERDLADVAEAARLIQGNLARADVLIKSFKNLSAHQAAESMTTVNLLDLTREVIGLYALKARAAKIEIGVSNGLGDDEGAGEGYPGIYSQVLLNLLANAERYAYPEGGGQVEVRVETAGGGKAYRVAVRDFGRGIPEPDLPKVWEPFFTTGRAQGGSGLGLAIVRNLVTSTLGGRVGIESAVGRGTTVWFEFPKVAPPRVPPPSTRLEIDVAARGAFAPDSQPGADGKDTAT